MAILIFEHSNTSGAARLGTTLRDYGQRIRFVKLHEGQDIPADLDDVDGIISCGGPQSAYDDSHEWLEPEMELMRQAHAIGMPVLGLCLGSQILARALGGQVEAMADGIEFGWNEVALTATGREDSLHAGLPWTSVQFHFHRDAVTQLPPGARLLGASMLGASKKIQTWAAGLRSYGFQYHPEVTLEGIETWMRDEPEALREANISPQELRDQNRLNFPAFERLSQRLFESISLFLMPVDRRYEGLVKELHH